ncbi:MAG: hypothetical protein A2X86_00900 [Bdellovibrionales bacterium GWA2_49_15]|nr:MAG: hypothetical protein A2X86_00900 [Bdellovibrionales bacterium GWA2_49_15]HAZ14581.1 hypothetical protein [Bdellovibrionales bacterium]
MVGPTFPLIVLLILLLSCAHQSAIGSKLEAPAPAVKIESKKEYLETTYSAQQGECRVSVTTYFAESVNKDTARLRPMNCSDETVVAKLFQQILSTVSSGHHGRLPFSGLSMGRLVEYPSFSQALKTLASESREWNLKKGAPVKGHENNFATQALNELLPSMWVEKILRPYWEKLKIPGVEKVLIDPASKLPFDCQFWISSVR